MIIDEAHHCASLGAAGDREDNQRRKLAELLSRRCDALLLLTATPHDGFDPHFASLVELLDPSLVDGRGALRGERYTRHVIRRLKRHIKDPGTGQPMFRERKVTRVPVASSAAGTPAFSKLQRALLALIAPRIVQAVRRREFGDVLAFDALLKRSVSSARSAASTLKVVAERLDGLAARGAEELKALLGVLAREVRHAAEPRANVQVFTEYPDTQDAVVEALRGALPGGVLVISGETAQGKPADAATRTSVTAQFTQQDGIVLVSTDASAEGLNLHERCHHLIHVELTYNPNRLEQRNGRIDRFGQRHDPDIRYL